MPSPSLSGTFTKVLPPSNLPDDREPPPTPLRPLRERRAEAASPAPPVAVPEAPSPDVPAGAVPPTAGSSAIAPLGPVTVGPGAAVREEAVVSDSRRGA